jgi:hypothetical protein
MFKTSIYLPKDVPNVCVLDSYKIITIIATPTIDAKPRVSPPLSFADSAIPELPAPA